MNDHKYRFTLGNMISAVVISVLWTVIVYPIVYQQIQQKNEPRHISNTSDKAEDVSHPNNTIMRNSHGTVSESRNAQRRSDTHTILSAVYQYTLDNNAKPPTTITETATEICATGVAASICTEEALIDLSVLTKNGAYIYDSVPMEPFTSKRANNGVGYTIKISANGYVTVAAPSAEADATISAGR